MCTLYSERNVLRDSISFNFFYRATRNLNFQWNIFYKLIFLSDRGNEDQFLKLVSPALKFRCQITEAIFNEILTKLGWKLEYHMAAISIEEFLYNCADVTEQHQSYISHNQNLSESFLREASPSKLHENWTHQWGLKTFSSIWDRKGRMSERMAQFCTVRAGKKLKNKITTRSHVKNLKIKLPPSHCLVITQNKGNFYEVSNICHRIPFLRFLFSLRVTFRPFRIILQALVAEIYFKATYRQAYSDWDYWANPSPSLAAQNVVFLSVGPNTGIICRSQAGNIYN